MSSSLPSQAQLPRNVPGQDHVLQCSDYVPKHHGEYITSSSTKNPIKYDLDLDELVAMAKESIMSVKLVDIHLVDELFDGNLADALPKPPKPPKLMLWPFDATQLQKEKLVPCTSPHCFVMMPMNVCLFVVSQHCAWDCIRNSDWTEMCPRSWLLALVRNHFPIFRTLIDDIYCLNINQGCQTRGNKLTCHSLLDFNLISRLLANRITYPDWMCCAMAITHLSMSQAAIALS